MLQFPADKKPVMVWNRTKRCNLRCAHCYASSDNSAAHDELTTGQSRKMISDLAAFGCPVLLFSGGEPLMRDDLPELIAFARQAGLRAVLSTNGTLITKNVAERLAGADLSYVGVSLDGLEDVNDDFRGVKGAFASALAGIRHCRDASVKVGLRFTMNGRNFDQLPAIFDLVERENIPRVCFYHLVSAGRGGQLDDESLSHDQTRRALDIIMDRTAVMISAGRKIEILTVDNHADGPYVYLRLLRENPARAENCLRLLEMNGGNSSGIGIGCVSWNGDVHPDQFWRAYTLGNILDRPFSEIWSDADNPMLVKLRNRKQYFTGRCRNCKWLNVCNGNLRARAESAEDTWADDPACYLTDEECGIE